MVPRVPERHKKAGVCYAVTDDGVELPVVDVTNAVFTEHAGPKDLAALEDRFLHFQKMPLFFRRFMARRSITLRGMRSKGFLGGMTTYVAKLPAGVLGKGYSGYIDRQVAGGLGPVCFRLRLQEMARSIADGLIPALIRKEGAAVHLLNIGGGPAMDSLNALILVQKRYPDLLKGRSIRIPVLDLDDAGPRFGFRALAGLTADGQPLRGLDITLDHIAYDWAQSSRLQEALARIDGDDVVICSSEGALFEYASNEIIAQNLKALRVGAPSCLAIVGSLFRANSISQTLEKMSTLSFRTSNLDDFRVLAESAGWILGRVVEGNPLYWIVTLAQV